MAKERKSFVNLFLAGSVSCGEIDVDLTEFAGTLAWTGVRLTRL